jgi:hypothetical protein
LNQKDMPWQRLYGRSKPEDWCKEVLTIASMLAKDIEKNDEFSQYLKPRPDISNKIFSKLLVIWLKTKNLGHVKNVLSQLSSSYNSSEKDGWTVTSGDFIETMDWTCYALLKLGEQDTFIHGLSCLETIAKRNSKEISNIACKVAEYGIYAVQWKRDKEREEILKLLIRLAIEPDKKDKFRTEGIQTQFLITHSGLGTTWDSLRYSRMGLMEGGFFLHKIFGEGNRESIKIDHAKTFLRDYLLKLKELGYQKTKEIEELMDKKNNDAGRKSS